MTSNCDVTNSAHQIQMTTICRWVIPTHENFLRTLLVTAQSFSTLVDLRATSKRQSRHQLVIENWKITSFRGKEHDLVEEAKRYFLDVVGISSTKRRDSDNVELDDVWKLFYSGIASAHFAQAGVGVLVSLSPQLTNSVDEWIPLGGRVCMLMLKLLGRSHCLKQAYGPSSCALYLQFVEDINYALANGWN